jgi:glycosyltransferase involved in cell wall biosynthesis
MRYEHRRSTGGLSVALVSRASFVGGAEVALLRLAKGLAAAGHRVLSIIGQPNEVASLFNQHGLPHEVCALPQRDKWRWPSYRAARSRLRGLLDRFEPDLIHANDLPTYQITCEAARRLPAKRLCHHRFIYNGPTIDWLLGDGADCHIYVSDGLRRELSAAVPRLQCDVGYVVHDGLELPPPPSPGARARARNELGLQADRTIVVFTGQIIERKGVAVLLDAWTRLTATQRNNAALVLVGDDLPGQGAYRQQMIQYAAALGAEARFVGFRRDVDRWLCAADLAVVPSLAEPLGNATLEAMAQGLPVIGSEVGGIPEMINHGETGWLVPAEQPDALADALASLIDDEAQRHAMAEASRKRCEAYFSIDRHIQNMTDVYREILAGHRRAAG